uniref:Uncharacterized protein n=1 Tax=Arundo donax TaxID=35708 RepID=A0A0A9DL73_ARUDO
MKGSDYDILFPNLYHCYLRTLEFPYAMQTLCPST